MKRIEGKATFKWRRENNKEHEISAKWYPVLVKHGIRLPLGEGHDSKTEAVLHVDTIIRGLHGLGTGIGWKDIHEELLNDVQVKELWGKK